jgi:hypothetical protein
MIQSRKRQKQRKQNQLGHRKVRACDFWFAPAVLIHADDDGFQKSFIDVFYHQIRNGIQGCTTRAPPLSRGGRGRTGNQTIARPLYLLIAGVQVPCELTSDTILMSAIA